MIREWIQTIHRKHELEEMDRIWRDTHGCFGGYPPSFFLTHTKEEAEAIMERDYAELQALKEQLQ